MKIVLAVLAVSILLVSEAGFGPCPITGGRATAYAAEQKSSAKQPASASGIVADKGRFRILLDGQPVGSEEFDIAASGTSWIARGSTNVHAPGSDPAEVHATLHLAADGAPLTYEWSAKTAKKASASIEFKEGVAQISLNLEGASKPFVQEFKFPSPRIAVLDNNLYHQYAILARLYDWSTRGEQNFPVLIPQEMTPGTIAVEAAGPQQVEGATLEMLRVKTSDLEVQLFVDSTHRLVRLAVPTSKVVIIRE
jgi:hypothetical protein